MHVQSTRSVRVLSKNGIAVFRIAGGTAGLATGIVILVCSHDKPLGEAVTALGAFILAHFAVDETFQRVRQNFDAPVDSGLRDFASAFVSTSAVILGLLAVFGDHKFTLTTKVGITALVIDILLGIVLVGLLLAAAAPDDQRAWNLIRYIFNLALWALALGLLCITMALLYR